MANSTFISRKSGLGRFVTRLIRRGSRLAHPYLGKSLDPNANKFNNYFGLIVRRYVFMVIVS